MEGLKPFSVLHMFLCSAKSMQAVSNLEKYREYAISGKYPSIISILHREDFLNLLQYHMGPPHGGIPNLLQYYNRGGGVYQYPKFVLRNEWTAPYIIFRIESWVKQY